MIKQGLLFKILLGIGLALHSFSNLNAQTGKNVFISFYNQENLFDTLDNPNKMDEEYLPDSKLRWNSEKYFNKLNNMSSVILDMNQGQGPDFLGVCEVETEVALADLVKTLNAKTKDAYAYIFFEGPDERGIDNGLIYRKSAVKSIKGRAYGIDPDLIGGDKTRNILLADVKLSNNARLVLAVNHFPSRREGQKESEFKRVAAANRLRTICDSLLKSDKKINIVLMGDFNDHPVDRSMAEVLEGKSTIGEVDERQFYNPLWLFHSQGVGSHKYKNEWGMLDQILLSKNLLIGKSKLKYLKGSAGIHKAEFMLETEEKYKGNPKRTFAGNKYLNGYSDHLPVYIKLEFVK